VIFDLSTKRCLSSFGGLTKGHFSDSLSKRVKLRIICEPPVICLFMEELQSLHMGWGVIAVLGTTIEGPYSLRASCKMLGPHKINHERRSFVSVAGPKF